MHPVRVTPLALQICKGDGNLRKGTPPTTTSDCTMHRGFCLDNVQGYVCTTRRVTIPLFGIINIHGQTDVQGDFMWVHGLAEPAWELHLPASIVSATMCRELHLEPSWVLICLRDQDAHPIVVPAKVIVRKVAPANQVPLVTLLMETSGGPAGGSEKTGSWAS